MCSHWLTRNTYRYSGKLYALVMTTALRFGLASDGSGAVCLFSLAQLMNGVYNCRQHMTVMRYVIID